MSFPENYVATMWPGRPVFALLEADVKRYSQRLRFKSVYKRGPFFVSQLEVAGLIDAIVWDSQQAIPVSDSSERFLEDDYCG